MISFAEKHPELVGEWAEENEIRPENISYGSNKKVIWNGICGHSWEASIKNRGNKHGCPYCSGNKVLKGVNDLATLYPELVDEWDGVTTEELHDIALHNLSESQIEFKTMRDVLVDMMFPDGIREGDPRAFMLPPEEENPSMYVLSNADKLNGAAALLDAKTMEDISEKLGGDFIVLPSSVHETIVLPLNEDMDRHTLEAMVQDVNVGQVALEERLSDHVYMYDSQEKELVLADKMEERQQQRTEAQKDAKEAEQEDKPGKAERGEKKPERERVSMKEKLPEKKAEVAKNEANREHPVPTKTKETALG